MLAADVVGFHLFEYARHFMTSCRRLLGLGDHVGSEAAGGALSIDYHGRQVCANAGSEFVHPRSGPPGGDGVFPGLNTKAPQPVTPFPPPAGVGSIRRHRNL